MKKITLDKAIELITESYGLCIEGSVVDTPHIYDEELFLRLSWDIDGLVWEWEFERKDNKEVRIEDTSMILTDVDGEELEIVLLVPKKLTE